MKRTISTSTAAVRELASDLSAIVATLVVGAEVTQLDASGGWVRVSTDDGRTGWLRETELSSMAEAPLPAIADERAELHNELESAGQTQLETLVSQIEQVKQTREAEANRPVTGWQFATQTATAVLGKNYTFLAVVALILYTFMWIPGLIVNVIFLNQAGREQRATGRAPQGKGCLLWLLWVFGILPVVIIVLLLAIGIMVGSNEARS